MPTHHEANIYGETERSKGKKGHIQQMNICLSDIDDLILHVWTESVNGCCVFSLEEVKWSKWHTDLGIITKDPGSCLQPAFGNKPNRGTLHNFMEGITHREETQRLPIMNIILKIKRQPIH